MNKQLDMTKYVGQRFGSWLNKQTDQELLEKAISVAALIWIIVLIVKTIRV